MTIIIAIFSMLVLRAVVSNRPVRETTSSILSIRPVEPIWLDADNPDANSYSASAPSGSSFLPRRPIHMSTNPTPATTPQNFIPPRISAGMLG